MSNKINKNSGRKSNHIPHMEAITNDAPLYIILYTEIPAFF